MPNKPVVLLTALALGQQELYAPALAMLRAEKLDSDSAAMDHFVGEEVMAQWLTSRLREIRMLGSLALRKPIAKKPAKPPAVKAPPVRPAPVVASLPVVADLPKLEARFDMAFEIAAPDVLPIGAADPVAFRLRSELTRLSLFEGFDQLLCLPALQGVDASGLG